MSVARLLRRDKNALPNGRATDTRHFEINLNLENKSKTKSYASWCLESCRSAI